MLICDELCRFHKIFSLENGKVDFVTDGVLKLVTAVKRQHKATPDIVILRFGILFQRTLEKPDI